MNLSRTLAVTLLMLSLAAPASAQDCRLPRGPAMAPSPVAQPSHAGPERGSFSDGVSRANSAVGAAGNAATQGASLLKGAADSKAQAVRDARLAKPVDRAALGNKKLRLMRKEAAFLDDAAGGARRLSNGLAVAGGCLTAADQYNQSAHDGVVGKATDAVGCGFYTTGVLMQHPGIALGDLATGGQVSKTTNGAVKNITAAAEVATTNDTRTARAVHNNNKSGKNGLVLKGAAWTGDNLSNGLAPSSAADAARWNADNASGKNGWMNQKLSNFGDWLGSQLYD